MGSKGIVCLETRGAWWFHILVRARVSCSLSADLAVCLQRNTLDRCRIGLFRSMMKYRFGTCFA